MYLCLCKKNIQIFLNEDMYIQICSNHYPRGTDVHNGGGRWGELSQRIIYTEKSFKN